jgi:protein SCO1/2
MALGSQYRILTVSINPGETPALAAAKKKSYSERYGRSGAGEGWAFLTGEEKSIRPLADAVGFHYVYDPELKQYAHPTGIVVLTPSGKISHYFFGVEFDPKDLKLSLLQAAEGKIGSPVDRIILSCYHYDPLSGKYNLVIMRVVQLAGLSTVAAIAIMIAVLSL